MKKKVKRKRRPIYVCIFCGRHDRDVQHLIVGMNQRHKGVVEHLGICDACVHICVEILINQQKSGAESSGPAPHQEVSQ